MTLKTMNRILKEFPWLWAIKDSWNVESCNFKILTRSIDNVNFREMLGDFLRDSIEVYVHTTNKSGYSLRKLHKYPFGPNGQLIESDLFLRQESKLRHIVVMSSPTCDRNIALVQKFTILRIK